MNILRKSIAVGGGFGVLYSIIRIKKGGNVSKPND